MSTNAKTIAGRDNRWRWSFRYCEAGNLTTAKRGRPFTPGADSRRNTRGRPPRKSWASHFDDVFTDDARKKIAAKVRDAAKRGDWKALELALDRMEGKPRQAVEHSGPDGTAIVLRWENDADA